MTLVSGASKMHDAGSVTMSEETSGSVEYRRKRPSAAFSTAALTSSTEVSRPASNERSVADPVGTGTRTAYPSSLPLSSGSTRPIAFAAPVEVGTRLSAAARARRGSLWMLSWRFWSAVYAWIVVIRPLLMPRPSCSAFAIGARQFVVHDAFEMTVWASGSYDVWLTPMTTVTSSLAAGGEMMTFLAPPLSTCARALVASVKKPVDSTTTSTPTSAHLRLAGSRSANVLTTWSPTRISSSVWVTSASRRPRIESNFRSGARDLLS